MKINAQDILNTIWIEKYRPQNIEDIALKEETKNIIKKYISEGIIPNLFLCSRPGQGKTSLAKMLAYNYMKADVRYINASEQNNVDTVRGEIADFARTMPSPGKTFKIIILDEVDGFANQQAQKILRGLMEDAADNTRFILTANYSNKVIDAVKSRCTALDIKPDSKAVIKRCVDILQAEGVKGIKDNIHNLIGLVKKYYPDVRSIIKVLQSSVTVDGELNIKDYSVDAVFMSTLVDYIKGDNPIEIRNYLIDNETVYNSDHYSLITEFYHYIMSVDTVTDDIKAKWTLIAADAIAKFSLVVDPELNASSCFFRMHYEFKKSK